MHYAFGDEASGLGPGSNYFVFSMLVVPHGHPVETQIKRLMRRMGKRLGGNEIKATHVGKPVVKQLLRSMVRFDFSVVAVIVDKRGVVFTDPEKVYRQTVALAVRRCAERWPSLDIILDKHYTSPGPQAKLDREITSALTDEQRARVRVRPGIFYQIKPLQAADCLVWAIWRKYERGDDDLYRIVTDKIVSEEIVRGKRKSGLPGL